MDTLFQRVGIDRLSEIMNIRNVSGFLGCSGHTDLRGGGEIFQYLAPCRILGGAAPVTFVDHDQVEKTGRKLPVSLLAFFRSGDRLIEAEVDLIGVVDFASPAWSSLRQRGGNR